MSNKMTMRAFLGKILDPVHNNTVFTEALRIPALREQIESYRKARAVVRISLKGLVDDFYRAWRITGWSIRPHLEWKPAGVGGTVLEPQPFGTIPLFGTDDLFLRRLRWRLYVEASTSLTIRRKRNHNPDQGKMNYLPTDCWPSSHIPTLGMIRGMRIFAPEDRKRFQKDYCDINELFEYYDLLFTNLREVVYRQMIVPHPCVLAAECGAAYVGTAHQPILYRKNNRNLDDNSGPVEDLLGG